MQTLDLGLRSGDLADAAMDDVTYKHGHGARLSPLPATTKREEGGL